MIVFFFREQNMKSLALLSQTKAKKKTKNNSTGTATTHTKVGDKGAKTQRPFDRKS